MKKTMLLLPMALSSMVLSSCMYDGWHYRHHKHYGYGHGHYHGYYPESEFNRNLSNNYARMADEEAAGYDWRDAERFARKSDRVAHNWDVMPEDPTRWGLKGELMHEFQEYRDIVMAINTPENRRKYPKKLADLISSFDAMLEEQAEAVSVEQILKKRDTFMKNLRFFYGKFAYVPHGVVTHTDVLFFHPGSSYIGDFGKRVISRAIEKAKRDGGFSKVIIAAHADSPGSESLNRRISFERAHSVKDVLMSMGIRESAIEIINYGEEAARHKGPSMKDRKVEITFVK